MNHLNEKGRVLVTGGTGFLGAYIIQQLVQEGYPVRAIRRGDTEPFFIPADIRSKVEWVPGDILDVIGLEENMQDVDAVIHAAAMVSFTKKSRPALFQVNIEGTANVVNAALNSSVRRFIHISSVAALGRTGQGEKVTEEKKWSDSKWNTSYAISKFYGEMEVWRGFGEGLSGVILNPGTILGYGDWHHSSCALFRNAYEEFPWYTEGVNGFVDVRDVAKTAVDLLQSSLTGERFIVNGDNWSFRKLFETMADNLGKKRPSRKASPFLGGIAWRIAKIKSLISGRPGLLTKESARIAQSKTFFDNSKILQTLPEFRFTALEETIREACQAYLSNLNTLK